jgi:subtilisin family serine protease
MRPTLNSHGGALVATLVLATAACGGHVQPARPGGTVASLHALGRTRAGVPVRRGGTYGVGDRAAERAELAAPPRASAAGVTVYLVDSGIRLAHREFAAGQASVARDFVGDGRGGRDCNGHGTHAAGIVGGVRYGVAPGVRLVALRIADCRGRIGDDALFAALEWLADSGHVRRPAVVNLSLSTDVALSAPRAVERLERAVRRILANGVTVVAAAGNRSADACGDTPGRIAPVITVSAIDDGGAGEGGRLDAAATRPTRVRSANYGRCVDLFAPGGHIRSAWWTDAGATRVEDGTSSAAAFVTGAAALYLGCDPAASPAEVARALLGHATGGEVVHAGLGSPERRLSARRAAITAASRTGCVAPALVSRTR